MNDSIQASMNFKEELNIKDNKEMKYIARVGRNILVGHRSSVILSHFMIEKNKFKFMNNYQYKDKIKGGILSMQVSFD